MVLPVLIGVAWVLVALDEVIGTRVLHGLATVPDRAGALAVLVVAWTTMTLAMMGPGTLPAAARAGDTTRFGLAYVLTWTALGLPVGVLVGLLATTVPFAGVWLPVTALLVAALWQLGAAKRRALAACGERAVGPGAWSHGGRHALACVGSCGPMMLVMVTAPGAHLAWMLGLTLLIRVEKADGLARRLAVPSAVVAAVLAVALVVVAGSGAVALPVAPGHHS